MSIVCLFHAATWDILVCNERFQWDTMLYFESRVLLTCETTVCYAESSSSAICIGCENSIVGIKLSDQNVTSIIINHCNLEHIIPEFLLQWSPTSLCKRLVSLRLCECFRRHFWFPDTFWTVSYVRKKSHGRDDRAYQMPLDMLITDAAYKMCSWEIHTSTCAQQRAQFTLVYKSRQTEFWLNCFRLLRSAQFLGFLFSVSKRQTWQTEQKMSDMSLSPHSINPTTLLVTLIQYFLRFVPFFLHPVVFAGQQVELLALDCESPLPCSSVALEYMCPNTIDVKKKLCSEKKTRCPCILSFSCSLVVTVCVMTYRRIMNTIYVTFQIYLNSPVWLKLNKCAVWYWIVLTCISAASIRWASSLFDLSAIISWVLLVRWRCRSCSIAAAFSSAALLSVSACWSFHARYSTSDISLIVLDCIALEKRYFITIGSTASTPLPDGACVLGVAITTDEVSDTQMCKRTTYD